MRELALFAGAGGGLLASRLLGFETVAAVEIEPFCREVLQARQADGMLEDFPIYEDVRAFDSRPWRGKVDIVTGGFPCQDISSANNERARGLSGKKSGLWWDMWRICGEVGAQYLYLENSPELTGRGLGDILGAMAARGWDAEWIVLGAGHMGAPHIRRRVWLLACDPNRSRQPTESVHDEVAKLPKLASDPNNTGRKERWKHKPAEARLSKWCPSWPPEPGVGRVVNGVASKLDGRHRRARLKALGNGQVPRVAAAAFSILWHRLMRDQDGRD